MTVFMNGEFVPANEARVGIMSHAFSYGTGCFEGIRGYWNDQTEELYLFRLREHYERLHRSCRIMNIELPYTVDELTAITIDLVRRNNLRENCYIRPCAYKANEIIGVRLNDLDDAFVLYALPMGDYIATTGLRCCVSSWRRVDDNMIPARAKVSGAYVNSAFAKSEALMNGFDEAIMLTSEGHVSEGSAENIFMVVGGELVTPSASENILPGITRDTIIQLAHRELDRITRERQIDRTELYVADEIFLTGTGAQICPVIEVDHRPVGTGAMGTLTETLQRIYHEVVRGMRPGYHDWLTPVYAKSPISHAEHAVAAGKAASNGQNGHSTHNGHNGHNSHAKTRSGGKARTR
jgi:branched-chain amino acid aminotransferase